MTIHQSDAHCNGTLTKNFQELKEGRSREVVEFDEFEGVLELPFGHNIRHGLSVCVFDSSKMNINAMTYLLEHLKHSSADTRSVNHFGDF